MTAATPLSPDELFAANRARGRIEADFGRTGARTEVRGLFETGGYRLRLPRGRSAGCEAVMVNTGGGMAAGDRAGFGFSVGAGAAVTLTTTAAEKIYRGGLAATRIDVDLVVAPGGSLEWLPQETILYEGAVLERRLAADLAPDASLLVAELLVFGRLAMGERMRSGRVVDRWRLRRGGRLVLAEELSLSGMPAELLDRPALGGGARASATVALISPAAEACLETVRAALAAEVTGGASAWNGMMVARATSPSPERLRAAIVKVLASMRGRALPRLWS